MINPCGIFFFFNFYLKKRSGMTVTHSPIWPYNIFFNIYFFLKMQVGDTSLT